MTFFYSNIGSIMCYFWDVQCREISRPWNLIQWSLKVIESGTIRCTGCWQTRATCILL